MINSGGLIIRKVLRIHTPNPSCSKVLTNQPNLTSTIKKAKFNYNNVFVNMRFNLNIYNIAIIL
jgi:hypothetical protein